MKLTMRTLFHQTTTKKGQAGSYIFDHNNILTHAHAARQKTTFIKQSYQQMSGSYSSNFPVSKQELVRDGHDANHPLPL